MPTLKQITCSVELGSAGVKLKEYGHRYTDGGVEVFIAVPETELPFHVRVVSSGYIAPGLAAYVFIDGRYQCNRNRQSLSVPLHGTDTRDCEVDFCFRQREEKVASDRFIGRDWSFAKLETATADNAPNTSSAYADNVGTIEVVVLRCKGADLTSVKYQPQSYIATPRGPQTTGHSTHSSHDPKRPSAPGHVSHLRSRSGSRISGKASIVEENFMGDMFGLFDGAGDEPPHHRRVPSHVVEQSPLPGYHWDPRSGIYRFGRHHDAYAHRRHDHAPEDRFYVPHERHRSHHGAHWTHGERRYDRTRSPSPLPAHPDMNPGHRHPPYPPRQTYFDHQRHHGSFSTRPKYSPRQSEYTRRCHGHIPDDLAFVLEICRQVERIYRLSFDEKKKAEKLHGELPLYANDPDLRLTAMQSLRQKEATIQNYDQEVNALMAAILSRMRRMDRDTWHRARDHLVVDLRLIDPGHPELREWRDPKLQPYGPAKPGEQPNGPADDGLQGAGQGMTGGSLADKKQREHELAAKSAGNDNFGPSPQGAAKDNNWPSPDALDKAQDANQNDQVNQQPDNWPNDDQNNDAAWNNNNDQNADQNDTWGNNNDSGNINNDQWGDTGGAWGGVDDFANHNESKPAEDNANTGWGDDAGNTAGQDDNKGWSGDSNDQNVNFKDQPDIGDTRSKASQRSKHSRKSAGDDSSGTPRHDPIIKSYWANWNKPDPSTQKLPKQPRDVYEYPAPSRPVIPSGKASDVSYGVAAGRGANYAHPTLRPEYLDSMEKPYAVFTFKYRSKGALEKILNRKIDTSSVQQAIKAAEMDKLMRMSKDELVKQMMEMKVSGGYGSTRDEASQRKTPSIKGDGGGRSQQKDDTGSSKNNANSGDDWGAPNNDWGNSGGGGGDPWGTNGNDQTKNNDPWGSTDTKSKQNYSNSKTGNQEPKNDTWGNDNAGAAWGSQKAASSKVEELFPDDAGLQTTGGGFNADGGW